MDELIITTVCKIVFFGLLIALAAIWYRRNYAKPRGENRRLQVIQSHFLGNKEKLLLVELDQHVLLLGVTANQISVLHTSLTEEAGCTDQSPLNLKPVTFQQMT
jgi:flagellar protein FliO/FliZ